MIPLPDIDTEYLIGKVPKLSAVKFKLHSWHQVGERLAIGLLRPGLSRNARSRVWMRARVELYRLLATRDPLHEQLRNQLETSPPQTTQELVHLLANWLTEVVEIPLAVAASIVSVALFQIAEHSVHDLLPTGSEDVGG